MINSNKCYGFIPARYESSRFPGKPLAEIANKPMFWHVYNRSIQCPYLDQVYLVTDDNRIYDASLNLEIPVLMTAKHHASGTDRILEACGHLNITGESVILNIQGDEPLLHPEMLTQLIDPFEREEVQVSTLTRQITNPEAENPNLVKVIFSHQHKALYFSRSKIPYYAGSSQNPIYWGHVGLYAYKLDVLKRFATLGPSFLEQTEKLEQLRFLEAGIPIHIQQTTHKSYGVDEPEDLRIVKSILEQEQSDAGNFGS